MSVRLGYWELSTIAGRRYAVVRLASQHILWTERTIYILSDCEEGYVVRVYIII